MRCEKCNVEVGSSNVCPLCHQKLDDNPNIHIVKNFPPKQKHRPLPLKISVTNIYLIAAFVISLISIMVCYLVKPITYHWCWFLVATLAYGYLLLANTVYSHSEIGAKIFIQGACLISLSYIFDAVFGTAIATEYCLPIIISLMIAILGLNLIVFRKHNRSLFVSCTFMSLLGFIPIILYLCDVTALFIPAIISAVIGGLTLILCLAFGIKRLKEQLAKVFNM